MSTDQSLRTLLRALQSTSNHQEVSRLLGSATTLLTLLHNPLNVTLLTSQILCAPSVWQRPDGVRSTIGILSIFNSAAIHLVQRQAKPKSASSFAEEEVLDREEWTIAVVKGADDKSPRWRHLCVLAGLLIGFEGHGQQNISLALRHKLENAIVQATNLALRDQEESSDMASNSMVILLSHVFDILSDKEKLNLSHDLLLPILYRTPLFAREGLYSGYFLSTIDADITQVGLEKFDWSAKSSTYVQCQRMVSGPIVSSLGALSRFIAFSLENVENVDLLSTLVTDLSAFSRSLCVQWRQNKFSEIDITEEPTFLSNETLNTTLPLLLRLLKSIMFFVVTILRAVLARVLGDPQIPVDSAPFLAIQTLQILRNLYFTSSRQGANAFSQYTFVYLTAIDILSQYPVQAEAFLHEIRPGSSESISRHPLDRCFDLYFLNTAENFAIGLSPEVNEKLLVSAAAPYLGVGSDPRLLEIFEAAHSVMLAVFASPQNSGVLTKHLRQYLENLFQGFPDNLSPRQFRLAVKTLIRITSPPSASYEKQPILPSTILELVRYRLQSASPGSLPDPIRQVKSGNNGIAESVLSEQSVLVFALIDALVYLPIDELKDWLPLVAESLEGVGDAQQLQILRQRFWQALSDGEMDVQRAALCVTWWSTKGGREMVLDGFSQQEEGPFMNGGLQDHHRL